METEYASMKAQEVETGQHNRDLHKSILKSWKTDSPDMWANLRKDGPNFANKLAYVLQERMWDRYDSLVKAGMNMTDARRIANEDLLRLSRRRGRTKAGATWTSTRPRYRKRLDN